MPTILEDPAIPHHVTPFQPQNQLLQYRTVILKDHITVATIIPIVSGAASVPLGLLGFLHEEFNREVERGETYAIDQPLSLEAFGASWFGTFAAVMVLGNENKLQDGRDWETDCLGIFSIKPNYPGRSKHICSGNFLVCYGARGKGVGKLLGEAYLEYAPKLSYTYSVFNLVFETNTASTKTWDSLGFKRIGLIKGAGRLKGHTNPVDAIIYGRELGEDEDYVSEERFDKIRFYLEKGKYPPNADRSEKSRLRSATTHYRLEGNKLLLKDKEVISDGHEQYEIAKRIHRLNHGGINKTTAMIADKYHWVRIKETVSAVIKNCVECKETARAPVVRGERTSNSPRPSGVATGQAPLPQQQQPQTSQLQAQAQPQPPTTTGPPQMLSQFDLSTIPTQMVPNPLQQQSLQNQIHNQIQQSQQIQSQLQSSLPSQHGQPHSLPSQMTMSSAGLGVADMDIPVDPAMMNDVTHMSHHQHQLAPQHQHHPQQHQHHPHPQAHHHPHAHQAHQINQQHHLQHSHHTHTHPQHIAPVAQMHAAAAAARLMVPSTPHPAPPTPNTTASPGTSSSGAANSATTDSSDFHQLDHHSHHQSTLDPHHAHHHSAEIARAALTEEGRAIQDQLEGLGGINAVNVDALGLVGVGMQVGVSVGVGVGVGVDVGVVGVSSHGQEMELDERDLYPHHHGGDEADMKGLV